MRRAIGIAASLTIVGCGEGVTKPATPTAVADASASASAAAAPSASTSALPRGADSRVVVAIEGAGLYALETGGAKPLFATKNGLVSLAVAPDGVVFASFYDDGTIRVDDAGARAISPRRFKRILPIDADHGFAVTDDIEWEVVRFEGATFTTEADRHRFVGKYDDNKFEDAAVDAGGELWVSSWNGFYARASGAWNLVAPPEGHRPPDALTFLHGGLVANLGGDCFARDKDAWRATPCPDAAARRALKEPALDVALDERGRVWIASDVALTVFDASGAELTRWPAGALAGAPGPVVAIAIAGNGLGRLPAPALLGTWDIGGTIQIYKNQDPYADREVWLCQGRTTCTKAEAMRTVTTAADGSFTFADVPDGVYVVTAPADDELDACQSPFTRSAFAAITTPRGCDAITRKCELKLRACDPFEMPPPPR